MYPPPPPPKEEAMERWRWGGKLCHVWVWVWVWGVGTLHVFLRQSIDKPTLFKTKRSYELWKIDFTEPHLVYLHRIFSVFG